jgi:uncharacterized protein YkwD
VSIRRFVGGALAAFLLVGLVPAMSTAARGAGCYEFKTSERRFAKRINRARRRAGVPKLRLDPQLSRVARRNSRAMATSRNLGHTPNLGRLVTRWNKLGENVGAGGGVLSLHRAFMASSAHRANTVASSFRHVGVAVQRAGGLLWVTIVFQSRRNPGTTLRMPSC